jgi:hypothetical protein
MSVTKVPLAAWKLYKKNHVTNSMAHDVSQEVRNLVYRWSRNLDFMEPQNLITMLTAHHDAVMHEFNLTHTITAKIHVNIIFQSTPPLPGSLFLWNL